MDSTSPLHVVGDAGGQVRGFPLANDRGVVARQTCAEGLLVLIGAADSLTGCHSTAF